AVLLFPDVTSVQPSAPTVGPEVVPAGARYSCGVRYPTRLPGPRCSLISAISDATSGVAALVPPLPCAPLSTTRRYGDAFQSAFADRSGTMRPLMAPGFTEVTVIPD